MKKVLCVLISALILFSGCFGLNNTYQLDRLNSEEYAEINERAEGQVSTLTMKGISMDVENFRVGLDSSYWMIDPDNQIWASAPNSMIKKITITNHTEGLLYGSLIGLPLLVLSVMILNNVENIEESDKDTDLGLGKSALWVGSMGLGVGILSPIVGGIVGVDYTYIFPDSNVIDLDTKSIDIKQSENNIKVEVSSWEVDGQYFNIIWQGRKIRLSKEEVIQRSKIGDKLYITIPRVIYDYKFKEE